MAEVERGDILLNLRSEQVQQEARQTANELRGLEQAERGVKDEAERAEDALDRQAKAQERLRRSAGQTSGDLRRVGRSARGSSRLVDRLTRSFSGADRGASALSGTLGTLVPGMADGAMVIGDAANAAELFAGAGASVLRVLGPVAIAVTAGAVAWSIYAKRLKEANAEAERAAELATEAQRATEARDARSQTVQDRIDAADRRRALADGTLSTEDDIRAQVAAELQPDIDTANANIELGTLIRTGQISSTDPRFQGYNNGQLSNYLRQGRSMDEIGTLVQQGGIEQSARLRDQIEAVVAGELEAAAAEAALKASGKAGKAATKAADDSREELVALLQSFGLSEADARAGVSNPELVEAARSLGGELSAPVAPVATSATSDIERALAGVGITGAGGGPTRLDQLRTVEAQVRTAADRGQIGGEAALGYLAAIESAIREENAKAIEAAKADVDKIGEELRGPVDEIVSFADELGEAAEAALQERQERAAAVAGSASSLLGGDLVGAGLGLAGGGPGAAIAGTILGGLGSLGANGADGTLKSIEEQVKGILGGIENLDDFLVGLIEYLITRLPVELAGAILRTIAGIFGRIFGGVERVLEGIRRAIVLVAQPRSEEAREIRKENRQRRAARREARGSFMDRVTEAFQDSRSEASTFDTAGYNDGRRFGLLMGGEYFTRPGDSPTQTAGGGLVNTAANRSGGGGGISVVLNGDVYGDAEAFADRVQQALRRRFGDGATAIGGTV